jgi:hypothetical protein
MSDQDFITTLKESLPQLSPTQEFVDEKLSYVIGEEFAEHIRQRAYADDKQQLKNGLQALEKLAVDINIERQCLVRDTLEAIMESPRIDEIALFFGPNLKRIQKAIRKSAGA